MPAVKAPPETGRLDQPAAQLPALRAFEIDGIRGWASIVVLLYHAFVEMLQMVFPVVKSPWLAPVFAADLAVSAFFVLSGDALSIAFFHSGQLRAIDRLAVRRYFRLTVPILMSCLMTYSLMKAGLDFHREAAAILHREEWLDMFLQFPPSLVDCIRYSLINVYVGHTRELSYNPLLWTMSIEMIGSMLVFLFCYLWPRLKSGELVCLALVVALTALGSFFSLFFAGVLFGLWRRRGVFDRLLANERHQYLALLIVAAGLILYSLDETTPSILRKFLVPVLSMALVFCAYTQRHLKAIFTSRPSRFVGEISFPLYLIHFQVLISLMSWLVVRDFAEKGRIDPGSMAAFGAAAVVVAIVAAWCFGVVERRALKFVDSRVLRILD
jgi:peptidoglycan/LPS O-acetylase OafA/YrhL